MADNEVTIKVRLDVIDEKIDALEKKIDELDDEPIKPAVDTTAAMASIDQIGQGFDRLKQGASEIGDKMSVALEAAGKQETNKTFLEMAVGAETAAQKMDDINKIVADLPGDDTALQGLLSSAVAKDASLTTSQLTDMANNATDYFSAMSFYGKSASEAQQDMTNYLLTGNTAELERSPILQAHIDKLKEASTIEERNAALAEALTEEHWAGMGAADTYNNKLETFNGMLERGQYNLGAMFRDGAMGAMNFALELDEASGGLVGMGIAATGFLGPITDSVMGLGQMATGIRAIKDLGDFSGVTSKLGALKTALMGVGTKAKEAALSMVNLGKKTLISAGNALKAAGAWLIQKGQMIASTIATWAMAAAQAALNLIMSLNPIMLVVIAIIALIAVLVYLYYNVDSVREVIDNLGASVIAAAQAVYNGFINIYNTIKTTLQNAWKAVVDFCSNLVTSFVNAAKDAVDGFVSWISGLSERFGEEVDAILDEARRLAAELPTLTAKAGLGVVGGWVNTTGENSPGYMYDAFTGELKAMMEAPGKYNIDTTGLGNQMMSGFNTNNSVLSSGSNITINIESVDSEDRIQQIVRAVEEALRFDNETAGRSV